MTNKLAKRAVATGPVRYLVRGPADQPTSLLLHINYEEAPVPDHYYVADSFGLTSADLDVTMSFGNGNHEKRLHSRIDIVFPCFNFVNQLWRSSRKFHSNLAEFMQSGLHLQGLAPSTGKMECDKVQTLFSNNVLIVWTGTECLLDFFYISPKDLWSKPKRGEQVGLEPVVRVLGSAPLVLGFLDGCDGIASRFRERFPEFIGKGSRRMRIWNLSSLNELQAPVVLTFSNPPMRKGASQSKGMLKSAFVVASAAAAISTALLLRYPRVSSASVSFVPEQAVVVQSVPRMKPPLADMFEGRFSDSWSKEAEDSALTAMSTTHAKKPVEFDESELVDAAMANQQESLEEDVPRLSRKDVLQIVRRNRRSS